MIITPAGRLRICIERVELAEQPKDPEKPEEPKELWRIRELAAGESPPTPSTAVFLVRELDLDAWLRAPIGQTGEGEGARLWREYLQEVASTFIVGWENVVDPSGADVAFCSEYMSDGTINPAITNVICHWLVVRIQQKRNDQLGQPSSRSSRGRKRSSGARGRDPGTAVSAASSEARPPSAPQGMPTADAAASGSTAS